MTTVSEEEEDERGLIKVNEQFELSTKQAFPLQAFVSGIHAKVKARETITGFSFYGCEATTDEVFLVLHHEFSKAPRPLSSVKLLDCTGCVYLTDHSIKTAVELFPQLKKVVLVGCTGLTEISLLHLKHGLESLKELDATGISASYTPWINPALQKQQKIEKDDPATSDADKTTDKTTGADTTTHATDDTDSNAADSVSNGSTAKVDGCPLLEQLTSESGLVSGSSQASHPPTKLVILTKTVNDVLSYLHTSKWSSQPSQLETTSFHPNVQFTNGGSSLTDVGLPAFNVIQNHAKKALQAPFISERCLYMYVSGVMKENFRLNLMTQLNVIRGLAGQVHLVVVAQYEKTGEKEARETLDGIVRDVDLYLEQQAETMDTHVQEEYPYNSGHNTARKRADGMEDYLWQTNWSRACRAKERLCKPSLYFFLASLGKDSEVELVSPKTITLRKSDETDQNYSRKDYEEEVQKLLDKALPAYHAALDGLGRLNKSDIAEMKSFSNPPKLVLDTVFCVCVFLFDETKNNWSVTKRRLGDMQFVSRMRQFDLHGELTADKLATVGTYLKIDGMTVENASRMSSGASAMLRWVIAVYTYGVETLPKVKLCQSLVAEQTEDTVIKGKDNSCYPILQCLSYICDCLNQWRQCEPVYMGGIVSLVLSATRELKSRSLCTLAALHESMSGSGSGSGSGSVSGRQLHGALRKLHMQGELLYLYDLEERVVILDIDWFCTLLNSFKHSTFKEFLNGSRYMNVHPGMWVVPHDHLLTICKLEDVHAAELCVSVLAGFGIILPVPERCPITRSPFDPPARCYVFFQDLPINPTTRLSLDEAKVSGSHFTHNYWPDPEHENYKKSDVFVHYKVGLTLGIPASLLPRIFAECFALAPVTNMWSMGFVGRVGSVEVCLKHSIHATMLSSSIQINARQTCFDPDQLACHQLLQDHLWSVVSLYILVIQRQIQMHPDLHARHRSLCQGLCLSDMFSVLEIERSLTFKRECPKCGDTQMPQDQQGYLYGYQPVLPYHYWQDANTSNVEPNPVSPYSLCYWRGAADNMSLWTCSQCGITKQATVRLWEMQQELSPSFAHEVMVEVDKEGGNNAKVTQGVQSTSPDNTDRTFQFVSPLRLSCFCRVRLQVLDLTDGDIRLTVRPADQQQDHQAFDLRSGKLSGYLDSASQDDDRKEMQLAAFDVGDILELYVSDTALVNAPNGTQYVRHIVQLSKNNISQCSFGVQYRAFVSIQLSGKQVAVLIQAPDHPVVRAENFPLGSVLLHKTGLGNQWATSQVVSTLHGNVQLVHLETGEKPKIYSVAPSSDHILPLVLHADVSIVLGKEMLKSSEQMVNYLSKNNIHLITPIALFRSFLNERKQYAMFQLKEEGSKHCYVTPRSPQVLHQKFPRNQFGNAKSNFVVIIDDLDTAKLLNPNRFHLQAWDKLRSLPVCNGNEFPHSATTTIRDMHLLAVKSEDNMDFDPRHLANPIFVTQYVLSKYWCLSQVQYRELLTSWSQCFPKVDSSLPLALVKTLLAEVFFLYHQTFLLLQATHKYTTTGGGRAYNRHKKELDAYVYSEAVRKHHENGRCHLHQTFMKKTFQTSLNQMKKEGDKENVAAAAVVAPEMSDAVPCVTVAILSHKSVSEHYIPNLVQHFPNLSHISVTASGLKHLNGIGQLKGLRELIVHTNALTSITDELLQHAGTLELLDVGKNPIKSVPPFLTQLVRLKKLVLSNTAIRELPEDIGELRDLVHLEIKVTLVHTLPESIRKLERLETLLIMGVPWPQEEAVDLLTNTFWSTYTKNYKPFLNITPEERMSFYTDADVRKEGGLNEEEQEHLRNAVFKFFPRIGQEKDDVYGGVPPQIFDLRNLRTLGLRYQALRFLPAQLGRMRHLEKLFIDFNPLLEKIDAGVGQAPLHLVKVTGCPLLHTPPPEIVAQGASVTVAYLKRLSQGSQACYRTKLMFVGLGGAGKTSLMRALMSGTLTAPHLSAEAITDGIDISTWTINRADTPSLQFSVWDFAGQTVYYNTHQFFLSRRAVYVLVWNTRLGFEHAGLEFWLSSIACHCPDAPIFVVGTHADQVTLSELPAQDLKTRHPNIKAFFTVSSIKGTGIGELLDKLVEVTLQQPYMGGMIPEPWLNLEKSILSKRSKDSLLFWKDVEKAARYCGILGHEVKQAVHFIHELGSLQYFENELLKDRVVINPQWIVRVMACIVSVHNKTIVDGKLYHKDLGRIWSDYPKDLHPWLLRLTEVFDLTFPLSEEPVNMVPCLLPQKQPKISWPELTDDEKETKMLYKFAYLPAGLFNRAQVRLFEFSESSAMWKMGSILSKNGHTAMIRQTSETSVEVRVQGRHPENILLLIHEVIEALITDFFHGVKYEYHIPCTDCVKTKTEEPCMFSSRVLRKAIELKALFLQCHTLFHTLAIQDVQSAMPPVSSTDYTLQIQNAVRELDDMEKDLAYDVFFLYCQANIPDVNEKNVVSPTMIRNELEREGFRCHFTEDIESMAVEELAVTMKKAKVVLVLVSNEFVASEACQQMFVFAKESLQKDIQLCMIGDGREWMKSDFIGIQVTEQVFVNFQRFHQFHEKIKELTSKLRQKIHTKKDESNEAFDVFLSYAWVNSASALADGHARPKEGAVGHGDPRAIKQWLQEAGFTVWIDVEQVGRMGLFKDIATGMKKSHIVVACISDEYALSENCQMEFRFAHVALKKPLILAVVGTGFLWESTEIGMLSLGYPKINFQAVNSLSQETLLQTVSETVDMVKQQEKYTPAPANIVTQISKEQAFQELYEMAQRKFLRQLSGFTSQLEPYPRLFIADLAAPPPTEGEGEEEEVDGKKEALGGGKEEEQDEGEEIVVDDLQPGKFCIRLLCEHEKGWHAVGSGHPVQAGGQDVVNLWQLTAPYMARLVAIVKHRTAVNLRLLNASLGRKLITMLEMKSGANLTADMKPIYMELRSYVMALHPKQEELKRCYLPSGKVLWLCAEHQKLPRVTILDDDMEQEEEDDDNAARAETRLLTNLRQLVENADKQKKAKPLTMRVSRDNLVAPPKAVKKRIEKANRKKKMAEKIGSEAGAGEAEIDDLNSTDVNTSEVKEAKEAKDTPLKPSPPVKPVPSPRKAPLPKPEPKSEEERAGLGRKISGKHIAGTSAMTETSKACTLL